MNAIKNTIKEYGTGAKIFHWTIAIMVILMLIVGAIMVNISNEEVKHTLYTLHKSVGLVILVLMLLRLVWRLQNVVPALPAHVQRWQRFFARLTHWLLYIILILMPIDGWVMSMAAGYPPSFFGLFTIPSFIPRNKTLATNAADAHEIMAWTILALLVIHVLAALKHHFIDKDSVLERMLYPKKWRSRTSN